MGTTVFPALFIGHGSPMNVISINSYTKDIARYASDLERPDAIVVISAHWLTRGTYITSAAAPEQIYDFYGFPDELYKVRYSPPGSPETAAMISRECGFIKTDPARGIDHAAWAVAKHMFPSAEIPLLEISLDVDLSPHRHFEAGRKLGMLRSKKILFIGSGNMIHNLSIINFDDNALPFDWAIRFDQWMKSRLNLRDTDSLVNYRTAIDNYKLAFPTDEHYLPMLYVLGMMDTGDKLQFIHESIQNGSISMRSFNLSK